MLVLVTAGQASAADWPSYRGGPTQNMSRAEDPGTEPQRIWTSISSVRNEPCVIAVDESLFTVATLSTDFGAQRLFRVGAETGKVIWSTSTFETDIASSCPAADASRVYFAEGDHLTALDISTGEQAWSEDLGGVVGIPVVSDGIVYVHAGEGGLFEKEGGIFARDASDGSEVWSSPSPEAQRAPLVASGAVVSVSGGSAPFTLNAHDVAKGTPLWSASGSETEIIGHGKAVIYPTEGAIEARDSVSGAILWTHPVPLLTAARKLVADGSTVYVLTPSTDFQFQVNHLIALDVSTGKEQYSREFEKVSDCCGTTAAYPPFVKFGPTLYNHYRYFDAETGFSPGEAKARTHAIFGDKGCANEQDSIFAHTGYTIYSWQGCEGKFQLAARRDTVAPDHLNLFEPANGLVTQKSPISLHWKALDNLGGSGLDSFLLTLDEKVLAKEIPAGTESFTPEDELAQGTHTWTVTAFDKAGNSSIDKSQFIVDSIPPDPFVLKSPAKGALVGAQPQFAWGPAVDSGSGISHYTVVIDGKEFQVKKATFTPEFEFKAGPHEWHVIAFDNAGNSRDSESRSFTVDSSPPAAFDLISPAQGEAVGPRPLFSWEPADDVEGAGLDHYELIVDGEVHAEVPAGIESAELKFDFEDESFHKWTVVAVDGAGNRQEAEERFFLVDAAAPDGIELINPESGAATGARPEFSWERAFDKGKAGLDRYELVVDEKTMAEIPAEESESKLVTFTPNSDLAGGPHSWQVRAIDGVGNVRASESRIFNVDDEPPAPFGLLEPPSDALTSGRPQFAWKASSDKGGGLHRYELLVDGKVLVPKLPPGQEFFTPEEDLSEGPHTWSVKAIDFFGNERESEIRTFTVDATPPDPFGLIEPADGAITGALPQFAWEATSDSGAGLASYRLVLDGQIIAKTAPGEESFGAQTELSPGGHAWHVVARDNVGNERSSESRSFIVASPPIAVLAEPSVLALTGAPVTFDASASVPPAAGSITNYEWDLNGDGTFERDTGEVPTTTRTYNNVKDLTVTLRVKSNLGTEATTTAQVSVRLAPPPGHLGVTINEGEEFTNSRKVTISPVWPVFALTALVSNDGGFRSASTLPVAASIQWKLDSAGAERLPKTIYVRFQGGEAGRETYQDDIVLDLTKPKVAGASVRRDEDALLIQARDGISGVASMQVTAGGTAPKAWRPFRPRVRWRKGADRVFIRVRDRAGNVSLWRRVAVR
ncbi:MAG TPA: Ig-like domain-containing protein [Solirubrobacterales bacterium]|nr:Ig-like domain-containing protein [Solirubrobacterales bacterium]